MKAKIVGVLALVLLVVFVRELPWERQSSGITDVLYMWSDKQEQTSIEVTDKAVSGAEGTLVGEHQVDGANWSIPNILRHWFGVR